MTMFDGNTIPVDTAIGLTRPTPDAVNAAAARVIRSAGRDADPADVELILQALGLQEER